MEKGMGKVRKETARKYSERRDQAKLSQLPGLCFQDVVVVKFQYFESLNLIFSGSDITYQQRVWSFIYINHTLKSFVILNQSYCSLHNHAEDQKFLYQNFNFLLELQKCLLVNDWGVKNLGTHCLKCCSSKRKYSWFVIFFLIYKGWKLN